MQRMVDTPGTTGGLEPPHSNGAAHHNPPKRTHAPWEFIILGLFVLLFGIRIILGWTLVGAALTGTARSRQRATSRRPAATPNSG